MSNQFLITNNIDNDVPSNINNPNPLDNNHYSVWQPSGQFGSNWPASGAMPQSFSAGGWTFHNRGFTQQTFLGASIRSFTMNGGFGDSSSTLGIELVNDEYNKSDRTPSGVGDDVYHNGQYDKFSPPLAGSPVFFKFGQNFATVAEAYKKTFDDLYNYNTFSDMPAIEDGEPYNIDTFLSLPDGQYVDLETNVIKNISAILNSPYRGKDHIVFGGILQTYTQNRGTGGNPLYSVQVIDPREILSNTVLILNNYAGSTFNQKNLFNIYGFLEYNLSQSSVETIQQTLTIKSVLTKDVDNDGVITFSGDDTYSKQSSLENLDIPSVVSSNSLPPQFPITGTGFSRRSSQGIPYYRIKQAINALMEYDGILPDEYKQKGFGGTINFRGFNYVVDFGTLPDLPGLYYLDFDQINILEFAMEICDVSSRDLFVTLLPIIDHPACAFLYQHNKDNGSDPNKFIAGIIRLDAIDKSKQPKYGAVKQYIDNLATAGIYVENQDVGYELANITTDKFIVGAQEVDMYYFSSNADRDELDVAKKQNGQPANTPEGYQWTLESSLEQQILPYYGMLGKHAVSIPKGFGAYQQILLDATSLNANGVGAYYVATEMELRCAMISFDRWKEFLKMYNDTYLESIESNDSEEIAALIQSPAPVGVNPPVNPISNNYAVTVPRSVFNTYAEQDYGTDGLPYSPCNPPYGYPLYYKRMTKIGIPEGGLTDISTRWTTVLTNFAELKSTDKSNFKTILNSQFTRLRELKENTALTPFEKEYYDELQTLINDTDLTQQEITNSIALIERNQENHANVFAILPKIAKKNTENALKVYNFVKNVADECLGKKFLVKIPKEVNLFYENKISYKDEATKEYGLGPFGFKPRPLTSGINDEFSESFRTQREQDRDDTVNMMKSFLTSGIEPNPKKYAGALSANFNPIADQYEFNYTPVEYGGFFNFDLYANTLPFQQINNIAQNAYSNTPLGVQQMLIPQDLSNFINENGRVSSYVRFDHSQYLSLDGLSKEDFTQQLIVANGMIPDMCEILDNVNGDIFHSFPNLNAQETTTDIPEQVAFVKCSVSEKFFMPPKTSGIQANVHAQEYQDIGRKSIPSKIFIPCSGIENNKLVPGTGVFVSSFQYYQAHFVPKPIAGTPVTILDFKSEYNDVIKSKIIKTDLNELDTDHVYALITLPGRISPTKDARFRDSLFQTMNAERFKHFMTMDTVAGLEGFDVPAIKDRPFTNILDTVRCGEVSSDARIQAWMASRKALSSLSFGLPQQVLASMPSPVYPNLVSLSLMSKERCYGPWVSSYLDSQAVIYSNIGGRLEFIKDENLSPWNYAGYQLMNEAGKLQAEFSNSLLLFSERGGFTFPGSPSGNSLCKALLDGGPLVTNIQVDVSEAGIKTTYRMDLYTSSFGKLQKQKQEEISKISRERQKLRDERNALIRKGLGKGQTSRNIGLEYEGLKRGDIPSIGLNNPIGAGAGNAMNRFVITANPQQQPSWMEHGISMFNTSPSSEDFRYGDAQAGSELSTKEYYYDASMQSNSTVGQVAGTFLHEDSQARSFQNTGSISLQEMMAAYTNDTFHPNLPSVPNPQLGAKIDLYFTEDTPFTKDDITL
jgi:hypothetical protein